MKKILEINPHHPVIKELLNKVQTGTASVDTEDLAKSLYEAALINSGFTIRDTQSYAKRLYRVFYDALGIPRDSTVEELQVNIDDDDDIPSPSGDSGHTGSSDDGAKIDL